MADESDIPAIDPSRPAYAYVQLAEYLARQISSGRIPVGAMLAGERALAAEHGVSLNTARRAVGVLRERGLVVTLPAKGTFVTQSAAEPEAEA